MNVTIQNEQNDLAIDVTSIPPIVEEIIRHEGHQADEVSIHFVDEGTICALHERFFQDPSFTDCISFPLESPESGYRVLGEVFVCPLAAISYADGSGSDPYEEVLLYLIHGLLHIMGYDDLKVSDSRRMRRAEKKHIEHLKALNLKVKPAQDDEI